MLAPVGRRQPIVVHQILPARNRYLAAYQRWGSALLATVDNPADRRVIAAYLRWHIGPRLERQAADGELTESRYSSARAQANIAIRLLVWLRQQNSELGSCSQADIGEGLCHACRAARFYIATSTRRAGSIRIGEANRWAVFVWSSGDGDRFTTFICHPLP